MDMMLSPTAMNQTKNILVIQISHRDGKVFLSLSTSSADGMIEGVESRLLGLRTAERCFVTVLHDGNFSGIHPKAVKSRLRATICSIWAGYWQKCLSSWTKLQRAASSSPCCVIQDCQTNDYALLDDNIKSQLQTPSDLDHLAEDSRLALARKRPAGDLITFRVSAKCSGKSVFNSQTLARYIGPLIARGSGWIPDLRKPDCEVYVQLNNDGLVLGLSACRVPLSVRPYLKHIGLRTTIASIMASLAVIQPGMIVLDPMCGEATILIEAAKQYHGALYIGGDSNTDQCIAAVDNVHFAKESNSVHIINADVTTLCLNEASVDAVVSDIPFGAKHSTVDGVRRLLPKLIPSLDRVLKRGGRVVLLVGAEFRQLLLDCVNDLDTVDLDDTTLTCRSTPSVSTPSHRLQSSPDIDFVSSNSCNTVTDIDGDSVKYSASVDGLSSSDCDKTSASHSLSSENAIGMMEICRAWTTVLVHYVKLGETHAYICCFAKTR